MSLHLLNEYWLEFDGVDDYVQARDASVFDVTTGDFDMEVEFRTMDNSGNAMRLIDKRGQGAAGSGNPSYQLSPYQNTFNNTFIEDTDTDYINTIGNGVALPNDGDWHSVKLTWANATGTLKMFIDNIEENSVTNAALIGGNLTTSRLFTVGAANTGAQYFKGDIKSFRFGTETFPLNEGTGTTITGSEGTVLDIYGATWGGQPIKEIKDVYIGDSGILKPVKYIFLGTSTGFSTVYRGEPDPGQVEYTTPGTYQWVVPDGVESISAVVVGGGGGGACSRGGTGYGSGSGGGGGGLAYNTFAVTPGETLDIIVGSGGARGLASAQSSGGAGGFSAIQRSSIDLVRATGGFGGNWGTSGNGGTVVTGTGGSGGKGGVRSESFPEIGGGGGGAGGYSGSGGSGGGVPDATGGAGNGGAGGGAGGGNRRGGGGVGIYGEGASGSAVASGSAGNPGSGGIGLVYGAGGGGGQGNFPNENGQAGGVGAVRIIWGNSSVTREYPSTNTQDY